MVKCRFCAQYLCEIIGSITCCASGGNHPLHCGRRQGSCKADKRFIPNRLINIEQGFCIVTSDTPSSVWICMLAHRNEWHNTESLIALFTLIMLLLRGISDLASNPTEVLADSTPAWLPEPTIFSDSPQFPFKTDTSQCVLPAASSLGTVVSPRFNGGRLPSSPNSAIGTSSTHT